MAAAHVLGNHGKKLMLKYAKNIFFVSFKTFI